MSETIEVPEDTGDVFKLGDNPDGFYGLDLTEDEIIESLRDSWGLLTPVEKNQAQEFIQNVLIKKARTDFYTYVQLMAPSTLPEGFINGRHIKLMAQELQRIERRTILSTQLGPDKQVVLGKRLQIFLPPGSMKSKILNMFVTWCFGRHPKWRILHVGHTKQFAEDNMGRSIRDLMQTPEYNDIFPNTLIKKDVKAAGRWDTTEGGTYYCAGVGNQIAGRRAHISICDDVVSEQTAYSDNDRPKINNWYVPGLRTRLLPGASEIIVNTRWHVDDLSGFILRADEESKVPWQVVAIPAFLDSSATRLLNKFSDGFPKNLEEGDSFWPEFWSSDLLEEKRKDKGMSEAKWNALYMQNPVPEEGNIFKEDEFQYWTDSEPPPLDYLLVSMDTAFSTRESADFSAYSVWGIFKYAEEDLAGKEYVVSNMLLLESERGRWEFPELCKKVEEVNAMYEPDTFVIEKKASGQSLIQEMRRRQIPITEYIPDKDKISRAHACQPFMSSHRIWVPADRLDDQVTRPKDFAQDLIQEATHFPFDIHDDLTDTLTQAILWMRDSFNITNLEYDEDDEDDREYSPRLTYWNLVNPR